MKIADELKAIPQSTPEAPKTLLDRIIALTPVVMTVVATILAGLSSSEMSAAQYHRSMAAQYQSKAGDQWGFYQAKKMRQSGNDNTLELLDGLAGPRDFDAGWISSIGQEAQQRVAEMTKQIAAAPLASGDAAAMKDLLAKAEAESRLLSDRWKQAAANPQMADATRFLAGQDLPVVGERRSQSPAIAAVLSAMDAGKNERDTVPLVLKVKRDDLDQAEVVALADADAFDAATKPITAAVDRIGALVSAQSALLRRLARHLSSDVPAGPQGASMRQPGDDLAASFSAARLRLDARRYQQEAAYNMAIARLYEVEVRLASGQSDRNQQRSKDFFYGMLVAQAAVTIATFSLALRQRSLLWALASSAGLIAVSLGVYVYLFT